LKRKKDAEREMKEREKEEQRRKKEEEQEKKQRVIIHAQRSWLMVSHNYG